MNFLLQRYRRTALARFIEELDPEDRVTWWVGIALALAAGVSGDAIMRAWWQ